jgi:hypothetical protein
MSRVFALLATLAFAASAGAGELRVGFGESDVTPEIAKIKPVFVAGFGHGRKATGVHDPIMARAIALHDGERTFALVSVDVVGLFPATVEAIRAKRPDLAYVLISATHNHEGPDTLGLWGANPFSSGIDPEYMKRLEAGVNEAIQKAEKHLAPVNAKIGKRREPELLHDSRLPIVLLDELIVLEFEHAQTRKPHGALVQWNCHPETLGAKNTQISADFVASTVETLSKSRGCPVVFFNGAVGGLMNSLKVSVPGPDGKPLPDETFEKTIGYGRLLAGAAERALKEAQPVALTPFAIKTRVIHLPIDNTLYQLAWQTKVLRRDAYEWEGTPTPKNPKLASDPAKRMTIRSEVGYAKLGDLEIAAIPGEIYPELVLDKIQTPADPGADFPDAASEPAIYPLLKGKHRMIIGLANDEVGYLIPKRQWDSKAPFCYGLKQSQYGEINSCGPETAPIVCEAFSRLVKGVRKE